MVMVSVSETYDLHTVRNKMTMIGVHTPTKELIQKTYPGLCVNSKYCRIVKTDVVISSINSTVAVTPDMLGTTADDIAPEDLFNPILYKAVSNDSWSTLEARLMGIQNDLNNAVLNGSQAFSDNDNVTGLDDEFGVYYSLLSNRDGFRIAPIQQGLEMRGLVPLVFEQYYTHGENQTPGVTAPGISENELGALDVLPITARAMRGRPHPMPRFNTSYLTSTANGPGPSGNLQASGLQANGMSAGTPYNAQIEMPDIPPVMLACIIMPPSRRTTLWFRMMVRTWIEFSDVRPIQEITSFAQMSSVYAPLVYHSDYNEQSKSMDHLTDMVDTKNADIQKIMEGA